MLKRQGAPSFHGRAGRVVAPILLAAALLFPDRAHAQSAGDKAAAEALFDEGKRLVDAGKFADACPKFEESQRLDAGLGTMLYLADCYERAGRTASAWATFREAAAVAKSAGQADREQIARGRAEGLEPKLHRLALRVEDASDGLTVERVETASGRREQLSRATWGVALPIDPGTYRVTASAPGKTPWSSNVTIPPDAGTQTIAIPSLVAGAASEPPPPPKETTPPPPAEAVEESWSTQHWIGLGIGAVGVVGLGVSGALAIVAVGKNGDADDLCGEGSATCTTQEGVDASSDAQGMGNAATGALVAGGVLTTIGIIVFLAAPYEKESAATIGGSRVALTPSAPNADAGVSLGGRF
jgi:hypothetical protein